jgi:TonB family protein
MRMRTIRAVALVLAAGALLGAAPADQNPDWVRKPTAKDLLAVWPQEALKNSLSGRGVIGCKVDIRGTLFACRVTDESPPDSGFGAAALALTPQFQMKPAVVGGKPVESAIHIRVRFQASDHLKGVRPTGEPDPSFGSQVMLSNIPWLEAPTYAEVAAAYPAKARAERVAGRATLSCDFSEDGGLKGCTTVMERPGGQGFAKAAKALAPRFKGPTVVAGRSIKGMGTQLLVSFVPEMLEMGEPVIGHPQWTSMPSPEQFKAVVPTVGVPPNLSSIKVVMSCLIGSGGAFGDCSVVSEEPSGLGVGPAMAKLGPAFKIGIWTAEGLPTVGGKIVAPIRYVIEDVPASAKP